MIGTIRYEVRKGVTAKDGKFPISLIYSISGQRVRYSTGLITYAEYWDSKKQSLIFINQRLAKKLLPEVNPHLLLSEFEVKEFNKTLSDISSAIIDIEKKFSALKIVFSSAMIIDELKAQNKVVTKKEEPNNFLFDFMEQYIKDHESTRVKGSLSVYKSVKRHLEAYQKETKHKVTFETIDYAFFNKLNTFLINRVKTDKKGNLSPQLNNTTIAKALSTLKTFLGYARKQGIKVSDSYKDFSIKKESLEVIALEQAELDSLISIDLSNNKRLDQVRDVFVFACATGLRYSDVALLKREHIIDDTITIVVKKTKSRLTVQLNQVSYDILEKYKKHHKILPIISNQKLNDYIKELCELAKITTPIEIVRFYGAKRSVITFPKFELIHFHTARKTFCTLSLEKGMSAEEVMEISGHQTYNSFKRYIKVTENRKKTVMMKAWGAPDKLKVVS